jgi:hypothetical protein
MKRALATAMMTLAVLVTGVGVVLAQPSNIGWIDVTTSNPVEPAAIFVDDAGTNLITPQTHMPLVAGHHTVTLTTPDGRSSSIGFSLAAGQTTKISLHPHH